MFDKSFTERLNPALADELTLYLSPVCAPTLVSEIIADLKHPEPRQGKLPADLVRMLANKMSLAHGPEPTGVKKLVITNLLGGDVPMVGQVPIDSSAPGVRVNRMGMMIDGTVQQAMWARWSRGEFDTDDELAAEAWRAVVEATDLEGLRISGSHSLRRSAIRRLCPL